MEPSKKAVVAVVGDLHVNSTLGLCADHGVMLDDGGRYMPSKVQLWMWEKWRDYIDAVESAVIAAGRPPLYVIFNGDLVDGDHHNTSQIISRNMEIQRRACFDVIDPLLKLEPANTFVVRGTEAHVGGAAADEEAIALDIGSVPDPSRGSSSWYQLRAKLGGVTFDVTHHGSIGRLPWTIGNILNRTAVEEVLRAAKQGDRPADVMIQNHNHIWGSSSDDYPTKVFANGCWQFATAYVSKIAPRATPSIGGLIFTCEDGGYSYQRKSYHPDRTPAWEPK